MGRKRADGFFHNARSAPYVDKGGRRPKSFASTAEQYFVPSFAVRRPVVISPESKRFLNDAEQALPRSFDVHNVGSMAMTLLEKRRMSHEIREAGLRPDPEKIRDLAHSVQEQLGEAVKSRPRKMVVPVGRIFRFGEHHTALGIVPQGWRGYEKHYARRGVGGEWLPLPQIVRETNVILGALASAFPSEEDPDSGIRTSNLAGSPHVSFARRRTGGISEPEQRAFAGALEEVLPESVTLFDPVIYLTLAKDQEEPILLHPRSPGAFKNNGLVEF